MSEILPRNTPFPQRRCGFRDVRSCFALQDLICCRLCHSVYGAKAVLGTDKLNKVRGKAISLNSQAIGEFCQWAGAGHMRTRIIKKAKTNGDILGFLV